MGDILSNDGTVFGTIGESGHMDSSLNMNYYQGANKIRSIPEFQRDYNLGRASITVVREGRAALMKILLARLKGKPGWVVDDVQPNWYEDHKQLGRIYLKVQANQGGNKGAAVKTGTFTVQNLEEAKLLQKGDRIAIMCTETSTDRNVNATVQDYVAAAGGTDFYKVSDVTKPVPELDEILSVDYSTGKISVKRNVGPNNGQDSLKGTGFTVIDNPAPGATKVDPGSNQVYAYDAFIVKVGNSMAEEDDDQLTWALKMSGNYNYVQRFMRKWSANDMEEKVLKRGLGKGDTFKKNGRDAIEAFWHEVEMSALLGYRGQDTSTQKYRGFAGGLLESIPPNNIHEMYEPNFDDIQNKKGDFSIAKFNYMLESKGYYGGQNKVLICGNRYHTAFSTMINEMTQDVPMIKSEWNVSGRRFKSSNGLTVDVVKSDEMTLNGLADKAILLDLSTFQYGYLGEDVKVVAPLPSTNIHLKTGEIFGDITFKRTNVNANHLFVLKPNNQT